MWLSNEKNYRAADLGSQCSTQLEDGSVSMMPLSFKKIAWESRARYCGPEGTLRWLASFPKAKNFPPWGTVASSYVFVVRVTKKAKPTEHHAVTVLRRGRGHPR